MATTVLVPLTGTGISIQNQRYSGLREVTYLAFIVIRTLRKSLRPVSSSTETSHSARRISWTGASEISGLDVRE